MMRSKKNCSIGRVLTYSIVFFVTLILVACADTFNLSSDERNEENMTLEIPLLFSDHNVRTRAQDFPNNGDNVFVENVWIGIYNKNNGSRFAATAEDINSLLVATHDNIVMNVSIDGSVFYSSKYPEVYIVGVANFNGLKDKDGEELKSKLDKADTWEKFINISVDVASAEQSEHPLMSGMFSNDGSHKNHTVDYKGEAYYDVATVKLKNEGRKVELEQGNGKTGVLHFRRLYSKITVNVEYDTDNIELSDLKWQVYNIPTAVYLQERTMVKPTDASVTAPWNSITPNVADIMENGYGDSDEFSEESSSFDGAIYDTHFYEDNGTLKAIKKKGNGTYEFNFWHYDNKHWGTNAGSAERETYLTKDDGAVIYKSLCGAEGTMSYNNKASYFVIRAHVKDQKTNSEGDVQFRIHEGGVNDEYGAVSSNVNHQDFSCFRNTTYTYTIIVNGLNSVKVNATSEEGVGNKPGYNPGAMGSIQGVEEVVIQANSDISSYPILLSGEQRSKLLWRVYEPGVGGSDVVKDFGSDWSGINTSIFGEKWIALDNNYATDNYPESDFYKGLKISDAVISDFISSSFEPNGEVLNEYKISFPEYNLQGYNGNPENMARRLYLYTTEYSSNNSTWRPLFLFTQMPGDNRPKLNAPTWAEAASSKSIVYGLAECNVSWAGVQNAGLYTLYVDSKEVANTSDLSFTIPYKFLNRATGNTLALKANPNEESKDSYAPSDLSGGLKITFTNNEIWDFSKSDWQTWLKNNVVDKTNFSATYKYLTLGTDGSKFTKIESTYVNTGGAGSTTRRYFKFTIPKNTISSGKVKVKCSNTGSSEDLSRNVCLYQEGKDEVSKPGGFKNSSPSTVTFDIKDINTSEDTDIYIYTSANLNIYSIEYVPD